MGLFSFFKKKKDPPLLNGSASGDLSPSSPRAIRGRAAFSANEYVSKVVNICKIGQGTFAAVSLVIDRTVLESLDDAESSLPSFFAVKRISKRGEQARLGPGDTVIFPAGEVHRVQSLTRMVLYRVQAGADRHVELLDAWPAA